jgi:hypothetical protein
MIGITQDLTIVSNENIKLGSLVSNLTTINHLIKTIIARPFSSNFVW